MDSITRPHEVVDWETVDLETIDWDNIQFLEYSYSDDVPQFLAEQDVPRVALVRMSPQIPRLTGIIPIIALAKNFSTFIESEFHCGKRFLEEIAEEAKELGADDYLLAIGARLASSLPMAIPLDIPRNYMPLHRFMCIELLAKIQIIVEQDQLHRISDWIVKINSMIEKSVDTHVLLAYGEMRERVNDVVNALHLEGNLDLAITALSDYRVPFETSPIVSAPWGTLHYPSDDVVEVRLDTEEIFYISRREKTIHCVESHKYYRARKILDIDVLKKMIPNFDDFSLLHIAYDIFDHAGIKAVLKGWDDDII